MADGLAQADTTFLAFYCQVFLVVGRVVLARKTTRSITTPKKWGGVHPPISLGFPLTC